MLRVQTQEDFFTKVLDELRATGSREKTTEILARLNEYDARGFIRYLLRHYRLLPKSYKRKAG